MRNGVLFILLMLAIACKPYTDPEPIDDPRLTTPYCNDPAAINYNWDFPGIPDNSVCFFPSDVFQGDYTWYDSVLNADLVILSSDSFDITLSKVDSTSMTLNGRCGYTINITADRFLNLIIDSIDGYGQKFCQATDTIVGTGQKFGINDTTTFTLNYVILSDTGTSIHKATFIKK